jgi:dihydrofolate synthase/folylpolyglutamate synthase
MRLGLSSIRELLADMGHPHRQMQSVVVAGTNGKGTAAILFDALSRAAGRRTGLYTSPHILKIHERALVDGVPISSAELSALLSEYREAIIARGATFFEAMTALTLCHFARKGVELAVLETGLGGRLDATNVVDACGVLLCSVGADHQHILGNSLREIATEKLGLAKPGRPFYLGPLPSNLREYALDFLAARGAEAIDMSSYPAYRGPMAQRGRHQAALASVVRACYEDLSARYGWPVGDAEAALAELRFPYRYELVGEDPELILDTAHNAPALRSLLDQWSREGRKEDRILVLGVMRDKKLRKVMAAARRSAALVLCTEPTWYRSLPAANLRRLLLDAPKGGDTPVLEVGGVRESLLYARSWAKRRRVAGGRPSVLLTGSNFTVAEALDRLGFDDIHAPNRPTLWDEGQPLRRRPRTQKQEASR